MKNLHSYLNNDSRKNWLLIVGVIALHFFWILGYNLFFGYGIVSPDSKFYLRHADYFNVSGFEGLLDASLPFYYWLFPIILSICQVAGDYWKEVFLVLQCTSSAFYGLGLFLIAKRYRNTVCGVIAVILSLCTYDYINWTRYVLTDILFATVFIWCIILFYMLEDSRGKNRVAWILFITLGFFAMFLRPVAFLIFVAFSLYLLKYIRLLNKKHICFFAISLGVIAIGISLVIVWKWHAIENSDIYVLLTEYFHSGIVIKHRPAYVLPIDCGSGEHLLGDWSCSILLVIYRAFSFWNPLILGYSNLHLLMNALTLFPAILLSVFVAFKNLRGQQLLATVTIVTFTAFHSITLIDFDQRYRVPVLAPIFLLSAVGISDLVATIARRFDKSGC